MVIGNTEKMKILIGASSSKIFHLNEFSKNLEKNNIESKVVFDSDYADGFPSRKIKSWFTTNKKLYEIARLKEFNVETPSELPSFPKSGDSKSNNFK